MKPFYVHKQTNSSLNHKNNGFTAYIKECPYAPHSLEVQITFCSKKDQFSKKEGRIAVVNKPLRLINKKELPLFLSKQWEKCLYGREDDAKSLEFIFYYLWRYVV